MLIGILSDTHGLLRQEVIDGFKGVDHIIHAGDIDNKAVINRLKEIAPVTEELAESICRMYLTHTGVDVAGILQRRDARYIRNVALKTRKNAWFW